MITTRDKLSNLQNAVWKIRDAKKLIEDSGVTVLPGIASELMSSLEDEIDLLWGDFRNGLKPFDK